MISQLFSMHLQAAAAGPLSCNDERIRAIFKTELERDIPHLCQMSDKSRYGKIEVKNENGQIESISCCRNNYEQMRVSAELHLEEKKKFCVEVQSDANKLGSGSTEESIKAKINLSDEADRKIAILRQRLATCHSIGKQCKAMINSATSKIQAELAGLQRLRNAASDEAKKKIDDAVTVGGQ